MPKIVKIVPNLKNFEEILWLMRPDIWSDSAIFSFTRSILPRLDKNQMNRFFSLVLAPRFQEIIFSRNLNSIYFKKTIKFLSQYPSVFFSSIFLPICESRNCSISEGSILAAILNKNHFSSTVTMAILVRLLRGPILPTKCIILRVILNKNYLIPHRIIDLLVDFFLMNHKKASFPHFRVLFTVFLKNYFNFLSIEDKSKLSNLKFSEDENF